MTHRLPLALALLLALDACGDGESMMAPIEGVLTFDAGPGSADGGGPVEDSGGAPLAVARVFAGSSACAVRPSGETRCWGGNSYGELGLGDTYPSVLCGLLEDDPCVVSPLVVPEWEGAVDIAPSFGLTCAALANGVVRCAGRSDYGQALNGFSLPSEDSVTTPIDVGLPGRATQVVAGGSFACALLEDGAVWCWGSDQSAQIAGLGVEECGILENRECALDPVPIPGVTDAVDIAGDGSIVGEGHVCAVLGDGTVRCWGDGVFLVLGFEPVPETCGIGEQPCASTPTPVTGVSGAVEVDCESAHCCARIDDGTVQCWGRGSAGRLGDGTEDDRPIAITVPGVSGAVQVATGLAHTCTRSEAGTLTCWGRNEDGELGVPIDPTNRCGEAPNEFACERRPVAVASVSDAVWLSAQGNNTCVITTDGRTLCWGANPRGNLGTGSLDEDAHPVPTEVP